MDFSFSAVNKNMLTKMKFHFRPKNKVTCVYITELSYGSVANITFLAQHK